MAVLIIEIELFSITNVPGFGDQPHKVLLRIAGAFGILYHEIDAGTENVLLSGDAVLCLNLHYQVELFLTRVSYADRDWSLLRSCVLTNNT